MKIRRSWVLGTASAILASASVFAQENRTLEQDLSNHYVGRSFDTAQPYVNREVWYDQEGNITENPTPGCESIYGALAVSKVRVRGDEVDVDVTRISKPRPPRFMQPPWPPYASREVTLRFKSPNGWTVDSFDHAFQNSLRPRGRFEGLPPGSTPPPAGSDPRIAYLFNGAPVYQMGKGITPPRMDGRVPDPEYTDAARRARAGGRVMLRFIVNEDGSVENVTYALPPLGYGLDQQSARFVQERWRFSTPAMLDGQPVKVDLRAETSFCLY